jgi:serine/threonine-protein kinase
LELNDYRLERLLGAGTFGAAYVGTRDGVEYVVKVLHSNALTAEAKKRFDHEVHGLQKVDHSGVVRYVDHGFADLGGGQVYYIVMPFQEGEVLQAIAERQPRFEEREVLRLGAAIADALQAVHDCFIVHRDLKPGNIFMPTSGDPILLDFGLAKLIDYSTITQNGRLIGTLRYMAPEQATTASDVDGRADLYALGAIMYELLTGTPLFASDTQAALLAQILSEIPVLPSHRNPGITPATEALVMRLLEKQPHNRPRTAALTVAAIRKLEVGGGALAERVVDTGMGPQFFVHVQMNEAEPLRAALLGGVQPAGVVYGASQFKSSSKPAAVTRSAGTPLFVDPETHRLVRSDFTRTAGLVSLPWVRDSLHPITLDDLRRGEDYHALSEQVLDFLEAKGAGMAVAPYFHFGDTTSDWLPRNIRLISEMRSQLDQRRSKLPLWAVISTDAEALCDEAAQQKILNMYTRVDVDGYWFLVNFDEVSANPAQLYNYLQTLLLFRAKKVPVIAARVGSLGLCLMACGVTGFSSGMTTFENFKFSYFTDRSQVSGGVQRYYLEAILQLVTVGTAGGVLAGMGDNFACPCPGCAGSMSQRLSWASSRVHLLHTRERQVQQLMTIPAAARFDYVQELVRRAHGLARNLDAQGYRVRYRHFETWLQVLHEAQQRGLVRAA